ncbi:hypothetical protein TeGR_g6495 [Tetraparma gracilis]|uniref:MARVEL domain-containing protein n=1 Tax=Tetraparma gracilis TaxID=2962635 RepID=A0ABQ6MUH3_9STRA|nr:hypothetical protein TeGR_g6495 [Tetraparma gracilis]
MADILADTPRFLSSLLGISSLASFAFFISACTVAGTANEGFNVVIDALLYVGFCVGGLYALTRSQSGVAIGFLIGTSTMLCLHSLQTAVFWGQLANCQEFITITNAAGEAKMDIGSGVIAHYSCAGQAGMRSVCAFAVINFLLLGAFAGALIRGKDDLVNDIGGYDDVGAGAAPYSIPPPTGSTYNGQAQPSTADL